MARLIKRDDYSSFYMCNASSICVNFMHAFLFKNFAIIPGLKLSLVSVNLNLQYN